MGKREDKMWAKIAALTGQDTDTLRRIDKTSNLYSHTEQVLELQSVINFYKCRIKLEREPKETDIEFQLRYNHWKFRTCKYCNSEFVYDYHYEGVAYCSLDCLDAELHKIGLQVTRGRDLMKRWGVFHPAIVSAPALEALRERFPDAEGVTSSHALSNLPKYPQAESG